MYVARFVRISKLPLLTSADYNCPIGHDSIMFPCVVDVGNKIASPLARYYLYFAAHRGKGIVLALADEPTGPWRMYGSNPVYHLEMAVECQGHISSPDVVWVPERERFHLYYHGPNSSDGKEQHTGMAISWDGLLFTPWNANPIIPNGPEGSWSSVMAVEAHPHVREDAGSLAVRRRPIIYCIEGVDNPDIPLFDMQLTVNIGSPEQTLLMNSGPTFSAGSLSCVAELWYLQFRFKRRVRCKNFSRFEVEGLAKKVNPSPIFYEEVNLWI